MYPTSIHKMLELQNTQFLLPEKNNNSTDSHSSGIEKGMWAAPGDMQRRGDTQGQKLLKSRF